MLNVTFSSVEMDTESHFHDWKTHAKFNVHALNIKLAYEQEAKKEFHFGTNTIFGHITE